MRKPAPWIALRLWQAIVLATATAAFAQTAQTAQTVQPPASPPAQPCTAPEHRQFDFWLGDWTVTGPAGQQAGTNRIESILGGCVLQEHWKGTGMSGKSFNLYNALDGKWHQAWVDDQGQLLELEGGLKEGKMVLSGTTPSRRQPGKVVLHRVTWTPLAPGRVRQLWESSQDDGKTWGVVFDGTYIRNS